MGSLWERLNGVGGEARLRGGSALTVAEIIGRLEAGESAGISELAAADLLASLAFAALGGDDALGPALIQQRLPVPGSRPLSKSRRSRSCCRVQAARPGWPWPQDCSRSMTSGIPATRPPRPPMIWESAGSQPTGTASLTAASLMPAMPPTGFAGSAAMPSSALLPRRPGQFWKGMATTAGPRGSRAATPGTPRP